MLNTVNWYQKSSHAVLAFGIVALVANFITVTFFSFDVLAPDGETYVTDYSPLLETVLYFIICVAGAYFINHKNKVVTILAGLGAMLIGLSTFWLTIILYRANLFPSFTSTQGINLNDILLNVWLFNFVTSVISFILCVIITVTTFKAVFGKQ